MHIHDTIQTLADRLLARYPLVSEQVSTDDIRTVIAELAQTLAAGTAGDVVEFGCYAGTTSLFIRRALHELDEPRGFHVYDSFAGLPPKSPADASLIGENFKAGELAVSKKQFVREFRRAGLELPVIHKAWFSDLTPADVPPRIAFAFLDGDFYDSITASLRFVWPHMAPGGAVLVHDYNREALPGVQRAVRDFFHPQPVPLQAVRHTIAVLRTT